MLKSSAPVAGVAKKYGLKEQTLYVWLQILEQLFQCLIVPTGSVFYHLPVHHIPCRRSDLAAGYRRLQGRIVNFKAIGFNRICFFC